jgi:pimeloyl-ACP methyl ester carboxylesterase
MDVSTGAVMSKDGTELGYRRSGHGPGLILVHGAMQTSRSFTKLAAALSDRFTVYVPDRRGRGRSGSFDDTYGIETEVDDLAALMAKTGARNVFGLSSGALITLQAALILPDMDKTALYEPPLVIDSPRFAPLLAWVARYQTEMARNDLAAAMVTAMKGTGDRLDLFNSLPRFVLVPLMRRAVQASAEELRAENYSLETLIPTVHFDTRCVAQMTGRLDTFRSLRPATLLLGGSRSAPYLRTALDALESALPNAQRVELRGLGHLAADDIGRPERVAAELRHFFEN